MGSNPLSTRLRGVCVCVVFFCVFVFFSKYYVSPLPLWWHNWLLGGGGAGVMRSD